MHSYQGKTATIHHNGSYHGEVIISPHGDETEVRVDFADLLGLVAEYVAGRKIAQLEDADPVVVFGLEVNP